MPAVDHSLYAVFKVHRMSPFPFRSLSERSQKETGQPPALPCRPQHSTIGRLGLNHRVRDGYGCFPRTYRHRISLVTLGNWITEQSSTCFLRKEVIQPHLPIRLPCYDFTPVAGSTFDSSSLAVRSLASGISDSHGVTGGVYKTRERIHRDILIRDY